PCIDVSPETLRTFYLADLYLAIQGSSMAVSTSLKAGSLPSRSDGHRVFPVGQLVPFILVTALFFLWGIPNILNDVLIRQFMKSFSISRLQAGLVQSAFYMGYRSEEHSSELQSPDHFVCRH